MEKSALGASRAFLPVFPETGKCHRRQRENIICCMYIAYELFFKMRMKRRVKL